jgi:hypothetical protein
MNRDGHLLMGSPPQLSLPGQAGPRDVAQLVEHRSPKPKAGGSSPSVPAKRPAGRTDTPNTHQTTTSDEGFIMNAPLTKLLQLKDQGTNSFGEYVADEQDIDAIIVAARVDDQPTYDHLRLMLAGLIDEARRQGSDLVTLSPATLEDAIYAAA